MASAPRKPPKSPLKKVTKSAASAKATKLATAATRRSTAGAKRPPSSGRSRGWVKIGSEFDFDAAPRTPLESAQDLMFRAWEIRDPLQRIALAREALRVSPDCADAYCLLC